MARRMVWARSTDSGSIRTAGLLLDTLGLPRPAVLVAPAGHLRAAGQGTSTARGAGYFRAAGWSDSGDGDGLPADRLRRGLVPTVMADVGALHTPGRDFGRLPLPRVDLD